MGPYVKIITNYSQRMETLWTENLHQKQGEVKDIERQAEGTEKGF